MGLIYALLHFLVCWMCVVVHVSTQREMSINCENGYNKLE